MGVKKNTPISSNGAEQPVSAYSNLESSSTSRIDEIKNQNIAEHDKGKQNVINQKMVDTFKNNPSPKFQDTYIDYLSKQGYNRADLVNTAKSAGVYTVPPREDILGYVEGTNPLEKKVKGYITENAQQAEKGWEQIKQGAQKITDYRSTIGDIAKGVVEAGAGTAKTAFSLANTSVPSFIAFNTAVNAVKSLPDEAKQKAMQYLTPMGSALTKEQASKNFDETIDAPFNIAGIVAKAGGYKQGSNETADNVIELFNAAIPFIPHGIKSFKDYTAKVEKIKEGTATPEETKQVMETGKAINEMPLNNLVSKLKEQGNTELADQISNVAKPIPIDDLHTKAASLKLDLENPKLSNEAKAPIQQEYDKTQAQIVNANATDATLHSEDASKVATIETLKDDLENAQSEESKQIIQNKLNELSNDKESQQREIPSEKQIGQELVEEKPIEETSGEKTSPSGVLQEQEVKQPLFEKINEVEKQVGRKLSTQERADASAMFQDKTKERTIENVAESFKPEAKVEPSGKEIEPHKEVKTDVKTVAKELGDNGIKVTDKPKSVEHSEGYTKSELNNAFSDFDYGIDKEYGYERNAKLYIKNIISKLTGENSSNGSSSYFNTGKKINGKDVVIRVSDHEGYSDSEYKNSKHGNTGIEAVDRMIKAEPEKYIISIIVNEEGRRNQKTNHNIEDNITTIHIDGIKGEHTLDESTDYLFNELDNIFYETKQDIPLTEKYKTDISEGKKSIDADIIDLDKPEAKVEEHTPTTKKSRKVNRETPSVSDNRVETHLSEKEKETAKSFERLDEITKEFEKGEVTKELRAERKRIFADEKVKKVNDNFSKITEQLVERGDLKKSKGCP